MKIRDSYRIVFMGDGCVGKSSLISQFIDGYFNSGYKPTIEDLFSHSVKLKNGFNHNVEILDTAGAHTFPAMRELSIRNGRGFVLVFALDSESSFNETIELYKQIIKIRGNNSNVPIVLVGNKSDLNRTVTEEMISKRKAIEMDDIPYIETSAKLDRNIRNVFQELLMLAIEHETKLEQNRKLQDKQQAAQMKKARNQHLLRRLSTFGSLPNINLIRRKSNSTTTTTNNHSSNSSIYSESSGSSTSSGVGSCNGSPKHSLNAAKKSISQKPVFYSPIIKRKFNDNLVKPQLSLDETKIKDLNQRLIHQKILNTKSFDTASTTSSTFSNSTNSTNSSIKGSKESLETKCQLM